jgi:uncharacterized protein with HEPN domain
VTRHDVSRLGDVVESVDAIRDHLTKGDLSDGLVYDAVRLRLIEIGEAVKAISAEVLDMEPAVPWKAIARMRDQLAHRYFDGSRRRAGRRGQRARPAPRRGPVARGAPGRRLVVGTPIGTPPGVTGPDSATFPGHRTRFDLVQRIRPHQTDPLAPATDQRVGGSSPFERAASTSETLTTTTSRVGGGVGFLSNLHPSVRHGVWESGTWATVAPVPG